jgi:hypothetical protein
MLIDNRNCGTASRSVVKKERAEALVVVSCNSEGYLAVTTCCLHADSALLKRRYFYIVR